MGIGAAGSWLFRSWRQMNKSSLLTEILDASESLTSVDRSLQSLCGTLEQCLQWFAVELTIAGGTPPLRATTKPTKRFRKLLTAAKTMGSDDRGIKRSTSASRVRSRAHTSNETHDEPPLAAASFLRSTTVS
jgi:hypothetical protein